MKLLRSYNPKRDLKQAVVASIGTFDGVHLGHQHLIRQLKEKAKLLNLHVLIILFEPQPREYLLKEKAPARLTSLREKLVQLKELGVDYVYCIGFNKIIANTSAEDFARTYLFEQFKVAYLLVGEDFRFGKNREGNLALLQSLGHYYNSHIEYFPDYLIDGEKVSSTKIRQALHEGCISEAEKLLGREYSICGRVVRGDGRGRQWGIPTANVSLVRTSLALRGVYAVRVVINGKEILGVANLGSRPTVDGTKTFLEVHCFDFNESLYGVLIQVFFLHKIRDEVKFTTVDALISQIHNDIQYAKAFLHVN